MTGGVTHCAVIGCGPMGAAAALSLARGPGDRPIRLTLVDRDADRLDHVGKTLTELDADVTLHHGDVATDRTREVVGACDVVALALSWADSRPVLDLAAGGGMRIAGIGRPPADPRRLLAGERFAGSAVVTGAGLEPGLTEILARRLVRGLAPGADVRLYCGGVPRAPRPPLWHSSWFGPALSISPRPAYRISSGRLLRVPRFSGVELVDIPGLGILEAFHDGMLPWIQDDPAFGAVSAMQQKTLRWPGFAAKVRTLAELGLLGEEPVRTPDGPVRPKALVDTLLAPFVTPEPGDAELTALVVQVTGSAGTTAVRRSTVVLAESGSSAETRGMSRITGGVLAASVRLLAGDEVPDGVSSAHEAFTRRHTSALLDQLRLDGVSVTDYDRHWAGRGGTLNDDADDPG